MATSQQSVNADNRSSGPKEQWSEALAQRLQATLSWLREWGTARTDGDETGVEQADRHLWAEGPLPGELAVHLNREASKRATTPKTIARSESKTWEEDCSTPGRVSNPGTETPIKTLPKVTD